MDKKYGDRHPPLYWVWVGMHNRCTKPSRDDYKHYGGRGIKVCERWQSLKSFVEDMGPRPSKRHTLDRINNDGDYEPGNCRWATQSEQLRNASRTRFLVFNGERRCLTEWAEMMGVKKHLLTSRLKLGWTVERALTTPVYGSRR